MNDQLHEWALKRHEVSGGRTVGIYAGALGFGYNAELLAKKGVPAPTCWADLIKLEYKGGADGQTRTAQARPYGTCDVRTAQG